MTKWLLGITGGIAAYKTPELIRLLRKQGAELRVVLSQGAKEFVTPLTLQAVSGQPVYSALLDTDFEAAMGHISLARWADGILIAPLSANRLAALALGMADDLLTTLCLATTAPIFVAPAMNQQMWHHPAVQAHITTLKQRGITILGPDWGEQACGEVGLGRMLAPEVIVDRLATHAFTAYPCLQSLEIVLTAGPTREAIDPVRFLSNRSSGKMGYALAQAAQQLGAKVTLISGPCALPPVPGVTQINVISAKEMFEATMKYSVNADIFISAAAVADYAVQEIAPQKIKKDTQGERLHLTLTANPDILASVARQAKPPFCVGFAAETGQLTQAKTKLTAKNIDLLAVNDVSRHDIGFDVDSNALTVYSRDKHYTIPKMSKYHAALALLEIIYTHYTAKTQANAFEAQTDIK